MTDAMRNDPSKNDELVLVDALDRQLGTASKERAHTEGVLHRAFSVVIWRTTERGRELLLARRAAGKYHSAGLWGNSCCSHPRAGEELLKAACRRVTEELGVQVPEPEEIGAFVYRAEFSDGLVEYEYDHVLLVCADVDANPDPAEVDAVRWVTVDDLARELATDHDRFAPWALTVLPMAMAQISPA